MGRKLLIVALGLLLASCATQPAVNSFGSSNLPGFWYGLLHGAISPFSLIASIFYDVRIYAFPNNGGWYDFGFMLGVVGIGGGGSRAV